MKKMAVGVLAFVVWVAATLCCSRLFGGYGWDATFAHRYTLDKASVETVVRIKKPLVLRLFVSGNLSLYNAESQDYVAYVTAVLAQYQKLNPQKIRLEIVRVKPLSPEAEQAVKAGLKVLRYGDARGFFGLQVSGNGHQEHIAELIPERRPYLENDINRILRRFLADEKKTVGIVSAEIPLYSTGEKYKPLSLVDELAVDYKLVNVSEKAPYIPQDIKVLLILNPNKLPPLFVYALDQYLMRGGKLVVFVDPYSEISHFYHGYPPQSYSNINRLLEEWGIVYDSGRIVGSFGSALNVGDGLHYPLWFFTAGQGYERLHFRTPGSLTINAKDGLDYTVLAASPADAGTIDAALLRYASKKTAVESFKGKNQTYNLAVTVKGEFVSAYTQGWFDGTEYEEDIPPFVFVSQSGASLTVVADSDFFSDDSWSVSEDENNPFYGTKPYADNAEFILGLVDELVYGESALPVAGPKHQDASTIAQRIAEPIIISSERERNELTAEHNQLRRQIAEIKDLMFGADAGSGLQYRRQIEELKKQDKYITERLDYLNQKLNSQTEAAVDRQLLLNIAVYPSVLLLLIAGICFFLRGANLRRCK